MWRQKENIREGWSRQSLELDELTAQGDFKNRKHYFILSFQNTFVMHFVKVFWKYFWKVFWTFSTTSAVVAFLMDVAKMLPWWWEWYYWAKPTAWKRTPTKRKVHILPKSFISLYLQNFLKYLLNAVEYLPSSCAAFKVVLFLCQAAWLHLPRLLCLLYICDYRLSTLYLQVYAVEVRFCVHQYFQASPK